MEPVIKRNPYHHVLLMRDDKEVVSFKVHNKVLWYSIIISVLCITLGITGIIYGLYSWEKSHSLKTRYAQVTAELSDAKLQLEKLINLQSLMSTSDFPEPVFKFDEIQLKPIIEQTAPDFLTPQGKNETDTQKNSDGSSTNAVTSHLAQAGAATLTGTQAETPVTGNTSPQASGADAKATKSSIESEQCPLRITNFVNKPGPQNRIQIAFDLVTTRQDAFVRGATTYQVTLQDGRSLPVTPTFLDDTKFAITRMKNFDLTADLPEKVTIQSVKEVTVFITLDSGETFNASYPILQPE